MKDLSSIIIDCLHRSDDLRRPPYRGHANPLAGHCYVASEAFYHLSGGPDSDLMPMHIQHEGVSHWYLQIGWKVIDLTADQFATPIPYVLGRGKGFLTKNPSKRAVELMRRCQL